MLRLTKVMIGGCALVAACGCGVIGWSVSHHQAAMPHATCGTVITHQFTSDTELLSASPGALGCFFGAVHDCKSASIGVTEMGVDGGSDYVLAIDPGSRPCQLTEFSQSYTANFGGHESQVTTIGCRVVALTGRGVTLTCNGGQVLLPAAVGPSEPMS